MQRTLLKAQAQPGQWGNDSSRSQFGDPPRAKRKENFSLFLSRLARGGLVIHIDWNHCPIAQPQALPFHKKPWKTRQKPLDLNHGAMKNHRPG
jgi:hypothetical protein